MYLQLRYSLAVKVEILPNPPPRNLNHLPILHRRRHTANPPLDLPTHPHLHQLPQNPSQRLPTARLGDHATALDHSAQRRDRADLFAHEFVHGVEELSRWFGGDGTRAKWL